MVWHRQEQLNSTSDEVLGIISVSHAEYDSLRYVLLFPDKFIGQYLERSIGEKSGVKQNQMGPTKWALPCSTHGISSCSRTSSVVICDQLG